ncbi:hypothetical protein AMTRI_Chr05g64590 [Amborella trichopoda]|nr:probable ADP-ribosylation factor GTPase-activating protein AGD14 isoform X1 [Amborella trichopoda]|eukprot:XP_011623369.1 probable ADP-ribosylation factor GTPase-activating protein AGD14 isoform X1 [Amborella trichopoda]
MANRMKEDEKNEKIIRGLLKLPANRRCINCNSLGPQYVCTNFWTFVCTACSGIHREFTHRVKSVSMAKFTSQEVTALQGGGNERAKEFYFKEWDAHRHTLPDSSNVERLRDFIRHAYVERRYTGERGTDKPPKGRMNDQEDAYENRRTDTYRGSSRSPPYEDTYDRRHNDRPAPRKADQERGYDDRYSRYDDKRSPGRYEYDRPYQENQRYGDSYRRSPARFEVVDDRRREDRSANGNQNRSDDVQFKPEERSPNSQKSSDVASPPAVRPVRDILGDDVPPLRVGDPPRPSGSRGLDPPPQTQRTASSSSMGSTDGNPPELKRQNSGSLIDFSAVPEPPPATPIQQDPFASPPVPQSSTTPVVDGNDWASFDFSSQEKVAAAPSTAPAAPASAISQLLTPTTGPVGSVSMPSMGGLESLASNGQWHFAQQQQPQQQAPSFFPIVQQQQPQQQQPSLFPLAQQQQSQQQQPSLYPPTQQQQPQQQPPSLYPFAQRQQPQQQQASLFPSIQQQQPQQQQTFLFPGADNLSTTQQLNQPVSGAANSQPWNALPGPSTQASLTAQPGQPSQVAPKQPQETSRKDESQPPPPEPKPTGRHALPEDLFAAFYSPAPVHLPAWQAGPQLGIGAVPMQFPNAGAAPIFPGQSSKSTNPFDLDPAPVQSSPTFPSLVPLQASLPNLIAGQALMRSSSFGAPVQQWRAPQVSTYPMAMPPGAYMAQQMSTSVPSLSQPGLPRYGSEASALNSYGSLQHPVAGAPNLSSQNSFSSSGGNPFG